MEVPATKKKVTAKQEMATLRVLYELYCDAVRTSSDNPRIVKCRAIWDSKSRQLTPKVVAIIQRTSAVNIGGKTPGNTIGRILTKTLLPLGFISRFHFKSQGPEVQVKIPRSWDLGKNPKVWNRWLASWVGVGGGVGKGHGTCRPPLARFFINRAK